MKCEDNEIKKIKMLSGKKRGRKTKEDKEKEGEKEGENGPDWDKNISHKVNTFWLNLLILVIIY